MKKINILYISFTGMGEALGKSQVLAYLSGLSKKHNIHLFSFERKKDIPQAEILRKEIESYGINWSFLTYSNKYGSISTLFLIFCGVAKSMNITRKNNIEIIHARSMIPALMAYPSKVLYKAKLLFDIRGFSTDEKVDRDRIQKKSFTYKVLINLEKFLYKNSDFIVTLTAKAKKIISNRYKVPSNIIEVISTCANSDIFFPIKEKEELKNKLGLTEHKKILLHSGSVTGWYLFEKEILLFKELKKKIPNLTFLILNEHAHKFIIKLMHKNNIDNSEYKIISVKFQDVNKYINISDAAIFFIKPTFSKSASAPTKFAEYVAAGLPSITNKDVGDMQELMAEHNVGYILDIYNISTKDIECCSDLIETGVDITNYQKLFNKHLDKENAIGIYLAIYKRMSEA